MNHGLSWLERRANNANVAGSIPVLAILLYNVNNLLRPCRKFRGKFSVNFMCKAITSAFSQTFKPYPIIKIDFQHLHYSQETYQCAIFEEDTLVLLTPLGINV